MDKIADQRKDGTRQARFIAKLRDRYAPVVAEANNVQEAQPPYEFRNLYQRYELP